MYTCCRKRKSRPLCSRYNPRHVHTARVTKMHILKGYWPLFYFHSINHMLVNMSSFAIHLILTHHKLPIVLMCSPVFLHFKPVSLGFSIRNNHFLQMITIYSGQNLFYPNDQFLMLSWVAFYNIVEFSHVKIQITHGWSLSCSWNWE